MITKERQQNWKVEEIIDSIAVLMMIVIWIYSAGESIDFFRYGLGGQYGLGANMLNHYGLPLMSFAIIIVANMVGTNINCSPFATRFLTAMTIIAFIGVFTNDFHEISQERYNELKGIKQEYIKNNVENINHITYGEYRNIVINIKKVALLKIDENR